SEISMARLERRSRLREVINSGMPALDQAVSKSAINEYYGKALGLVLSGRARDAFELGKETAEIRERYGRNAFGQSLLLARRLVTGREPGASRAARGDGVSQHRH